MSQSETHPMSVTTLLSRPSRRALRQPGWLVRLFDYKPFLIVICLTPAIGLLLVPMLFYERLQQRQLEGAR